MGHCEPDGAQCGSSVCIGISKSSKSRVYQNLIHQQIAHGRPILGRLGPDFSAARQKQLQKIANLSKQIHPYNRKPQKYSVAAPYKTPSNMIIFRQTLVILATVLCFGTAVAAAGENTILGAGSTAAAPIYLAWAEQYQKAGGAPLDYAAVGSGAGIQKMRDASVHFGATDVPPSETMLAQEGWVLIPIAVTGIVPIVNLPGPQATPLKLSGPLLAAIFSGRLSRWNDPAIAALNPQRKLPNMAISVVVRSDGSGSTYHFSEYLGKSSPDWPQAWTLQTRINWPERFDAVSGSSAVYSRVRNTPGAIGYVDFSYAKDSPLANIALKSADGDWVIPGFDGIRAALRNSEWVRTGRFSASLTLLPGKGVWPITMGTFALVPQTARDPVATLRVLKFFAWSFMHGDELVKLNQFVRIPDRIQAAAFKAISNIRDSHGAYLGAHILAPSEP